jgi:peptidoglycan/xylan/chitin deacetylase (PgdA/CDA1 family)
MGLARAQRSARGEFRRELGRAARDVGRRLRRIGGWPAGPAILMYHRIAEAAYDPWRLAVAPALFEQQIAWLRRRRTLLPLAEFAALHRQGRLPAAAVAVTFDDGYACNAEVAAPILESLEAPATIFLTTGALSAGEEFWWDRLEDVLAHATAGPFEVQLGDERLSFVLDEAPAIRPGGSREQAYFALWKPLRSWASEPRRVLIAELAARVGLPEGPRPSHRPMTADQAKALAASRVITLGAHSVEHPALTGLAPEARRREIEDSRVACARLTGAAPELFAYPYGDYDEATVAAVRDAGFQAAVTTDEALVAPACDPLKLPRLQVDDWSAALLAAALVR